MIEVSNLTKFYGPIPGVRDVSFRVESGQIVGFLGPNGAGKTTTMRILCGFFPATRGTAKIAGFDVHTQPLEVKRRVGYLPENVPLYGEMLVHRFLHYAATIKGVPRAERAREVGRVMARCGLEQMGQRTVRNLSKGYRQRIGLAQALIGNPPVLVLDEPTVGLDPRQIIEIRDLIRGLAASHTVLLSTHILPEVAMTCQRVIIINRGRIVAEDSMANLAGPAGRTLEVRCPGSRDTVQRVLQGVEGVTRVTLGKAGAYTVDTTGGEGVEAAVSAALVHAGLPLQGLARRERTLEDVFIEAISAEEKAAS